MTVTESGMVTLLRPVQPWKALLRMAFTPSGTVKDCRPVLPAKISSESSVRPEGRVTAVRLSQEPKAANSMVLTLFGIVTADIYTPP